MTQDAQSALRRTMETYSRITRFCLICNYVTRIIDPLASRCSKFRFKSLDSGDAVERLEAIAGNEGVEMEEGCATELARAADGDLRKAITFLQSAARLVAPVVPTSKGGGKGRKRKKVEDEEEEGEAMDVDEKTSAQKQVVTKGMIAEIAGVVPETVLAPLLKAVLRPLNEKTNPGRTFDGIREALTEIIADGWPASQVLGQVYESVVFDEKVSDRAKVGMLSVFSEVDKRLLDGADEELVVLDASVRCAGWVAKYSG